MNAAPIYLLCFDRLPTRDYGTLSELLERSPAATESLRLLESSTEALDLLVAGSKINECDWGSQAAIEVMGCDYSAARCAARLALYRAERSLEADNHAAAIDDLISIMAFGRHLSRGKQLSGLSGMPIEDLAVAKAFEILDLLDADTRADFADRLGKLPHFQTYASTLLYEKIYFNHQYCKRFAELDEASLEQVVRKEFGIPDTFDRSDPMVSMFLPEVDPADVLLQASGGTQAGLIALAEIAFKSYDTLAEIADGHSVQRLAELEALAVTNPLLATQLSSFKMMLPIWQRYDKRFSRLYHLAARGPGAEDESFTPRDGLN